jgi:alkylhydroperoxidase/carboxymuconolactone decarboxylase family protein YurZ
MRMPSDKEANAPVFTIDPTFGEMAVQMGEATWSIPELSQREKVLICIAADVCTRDVELPLEMHVQMAAANQVPMDDVREAILQSAIEAGHTAALLALKKFKELCKKLNLDGVGNTEIPGSLSFDYFSNSRLVDQGLTVMWKPIMEKHWSRPGLTLKERAYISLTGNILQGVLGEPFQHNVTIARDHDAGVDQIKALCRFLSEFGYSRAVSALAALSVFA